MADPDERLTAEEFEARAERAAGPVVADRVRSLDRWLEERGANIDAFMKTTMVSMFPWWAYEVPRQRLPVIWPIAVRIEGVPPMRVMVRVVFQELRYRPPFDDVQLRRDLLDRLTDAGFDPNANLGGRPGIDLADLTDEQFERLCDALDWFLAACDLA